MWLWKGLRNPHCVRGEARTVLVPAIIPQCSTGRLDSFELSAFHGMAPKTGWRSCLLCFHFAILWVPKMIGPSLCHRSHFLSDNYTKTYRLSFLNVHCPMGTWWVTWGTQSELGIRRLAYVLKMRQWRLRDRRDTVTLASTRLPTPVRRLWGLDWSKSSLHYLLHCGNVLNLVSTSSKDVNKNPACLEVVWVNWAPEGQMFNHSLVQSPLCGFAVHDNGDILTPQMILTESKGEPSIQ